MNKEPLSRRQGDTKFGINENLETKSTDNKTYGPSKWLHAPIKKMQSPRMIKYHTDQIDAAPTTWKMINEPKDVYLKTTSPRIGVVLKGKQIGRVPYIVYSSENNFLKFV